MPLNLTKTYNSLLDMVYPTIHKNVNSFRLVFNRDFIELGEIQFRGKKIKPTTSSDGEDSMDRLFTHLTTIVTDKKTKKREFESDRSIRIHWVRYHIEEKIKEKVIVFSIKDENRTYILNQDERYVVILEPLRNGTDFYLLSAYPLQPSSYKNIMNRFEKRGKQGIL
jgi:hypothetical protein